MSRTRVAAHVAAILLACLRADLAGQSAQTTAAVDREYVLEATMLGYRGVGGEIDAVRNPTLWARPGETVRITMINGETMVHDVVLEKLASRVRRFSTRGPPPASRSRRPKATPTIAPCPATDRPAWPAASRCRPNRARYRRATAPAANGRPLNLDFENGTLNDWTAAGDAFELVKGETPDRDAQRARWHVLDQQRRRRERAEGLAVVRASSR